MYMCPISGPRLAKSVLLLQDRLASSVSFSVRLRLCVDCTRTRLIILFHEPLCPAGTLWVALYYNYLLYVQRHLPLTCGKKTATTNARLKQLSLSSPRTTTTSGFKTPALTRPILSKTS